MGCKGSRVRISPSRPILLQRRSTSATLMPVEIEDRPHYLFVRAFAKLTGEDLRRYSIEMAQIESTEQGKKHRITDMSTLDAVDIGFAEVEQHLQGRRSAKVVAPVKAAFVAPRPMQYGFARMFQTLNDHPNIEVRVVSSMEEAEIWVG